MQIANPIYDEIEKNKEELQKNKLLIEILKRELKKQKG